MKSLSSFRPASFFVEALLFLLVFLVPIPSHAEFYSLQIDQANSVIHTSGGYTGGGYGDINIWGTLQVTTSSDSIQFNSSGVVTNHPYQEFVFPTFVGTYNGSNFSASEATYPVGLYNSYSGTFDGTTLVMTGRYYSPEYDGCIFDYTVKATYPALSSYYDIVQKIYIGYFQRPADPGGLIYWAKRLDASGGNLTEIIEAFANSEESQKLYGTIDSSNISNVVNGIYNALFGRDAETGGLNYYINEFNSGRFTPATIMLNVLYGAQNEDLQSVNNKLTASNMFAEIIDPKLAGSNFQVTYAAYADTEAARQWLASVTYHPATVPTLEEAIAFMQSYIAAPDDPIVFVPQVTITSPTSYPAYSTSTSFINLSGSASDFDGGVTQVIWTSNRGGSGSCSGTTSWSCSGISLTSGNNIITVTAFDAAGNHGTDSLIITTPGVTWVLSVTPADGLTSSGKQGGPFSPSSTSYTLTNTSGSSMYWTAANGQAWTSLSATGGTLAAGASTTVMVSVNSNANALAEGSYSDTVSFTNTTNGIGNTTRPVSLTVINQAVYASVRVLVVFKNTATMTDLTNFINGYGLQWNTRPWIFTTPLFTAYATFIDINNEQKQQEEIDRIYVAAQEILGEGYVTDQYVAYGTNYGDAVLVIAFSGKATHDDAIRLIQSLTELSLIDIIDDDSISAGKVRLVFGVVTVPIGEEQKWINTFKNDPLVVSAWLEELSYPH